MVILNISIANASESNGVYPIKIGRCDISGELLRDHRIKSINKQLNCLPNQTAPTEIFRPCLGERLGKRHLLVVLKSKSCLAVSPPPALLCYDSWSIWRALYDLKHPVFHRKKLPINTEGSCGLKACEEGLWLQGCQFDSPNHLGIHEMGEENEKCSLLPSATDAEVPICELSKLSSGSSLVILGSSHQMRLLLLLLCGEPQADSWQHAFYQLVWFKVSTCE